MIPGGERGDRAAGRDGAAGEEGPDTLEPAPAEATDAAERADTAVIVPYRDGPLLVRGAFVLRSPDGEEIDAGRRTVALCRCGRSGRKPFCDGSHTAVGFRAPAGDARR